MYNRLTEDGAKEWFLKIFEEFTIQSYDKEDILNIFIEKGKELGFIEKSRLEKVRGMVKYYNEDNPYEVKKDKIELKNDRVFNKTYGFKKPIKIIFIQDLNRIVAQYELIIKEMEENK